MKITTLESSKAVKWVLIESSFYSKGLFLALIMLFDLKSSKRDFIYARTAFFQTYRKGHDGICLPLHPLPEQVFKAQRGVAMHLLKRFVLPFGDN